MQKRRVEHISCQFVSNRLMSFFSLKTELNAKSAMIWFYRGIIKQFIF